MFSQESVGRSSTSSASSALRMVWSQLEDEECWVPKDVPRGHLAVYVGEGCKRYVIQVTLLRHPLFKALLDHAEEVFGFTGASKLCIPCNESIFIGILGRCAKPQQDHGF